MEITGFEVMHDHVRAIYRALTGSELPEGGRDEETSPPTPEAVERRFAELEALARSIPAVAERIPPFSFAPPLDAIDTERELIFEVGVPGIEKQDVRVELEGNRLTIRGWRRSEPAVEGRTYHHAELPRGPFRRDVRLPYAVIGEPRVEVVQGVIRVRLTKPVKAAPAKA